MVAKAGPAMENNHNFPGEEAVDAEVEEEGGGGGGGAREDIDAAHEDKTDFDTIIGCIEDIVIGDEFQELQMSLLERHCHTFDGNGDGDGDDDAGESENKLEYTEVFGEYTSSVEDFIESELGRRLDGFDMRSFLRELERRGREGGSRPEGEVFEMLHTLTDFVAFKEMMVDFRRMRDAGAADMASEHLTVQGM